jgi:hypothetical protein
MERSHVYGPLDDARAADVRWFVERTRDSERRHQIFSAASMNKLVQLGNVPDWVVWLRSEAETHERAMVELTQRELARSLPEGTEQTKLEPPLRLIGLAPTGLADSPNAIVKATAAIAEFEKWAYDYQMRNTYTGSMGTIVPKASVNAIRSGYPFNLTSAPQVCSLYVDTRILPGANPMDVRDELRGVLRKVNTDGTVELFLYRPGFEAKGAERLIDTIKRCHAQTFDTPPGIVGDPVTSMRRDTNAFNELGIPAISYAPRATSHATTKSFKVKDLTDAAIVYARIAIDLCDQERAPIAPLGAHPDRKIAASVIGRTAS